ncbi:beta-lactamase family protein [Microbacterium sp. zg.B48]|uniref:serine hydrolase domain-containing protein n=1 Tax=Microbacterium sp. zg.B48 TaxID=2969408 RepID=UPI00214BDEA0|nr:serine hydrolase domain-containing protein [Microbacterium sp. zg.B48]MCR2763787.1 beta-lactamase family protein [Microbacterium sp. zg.B48]
MRATSPVYAAFAACAAIITVVAVTIAATPKTSDFSRTASIASQDAEALLAAHDGTSLSLALVAGDELAWSATFGAVDTRGTAPTAETLYGIGSVSKIVTTVAVMQLVDAGKVDLDAAVADYITDFRMEDPGYTRVTVRMLLNHSAGFPGTDYANGFTSAPFADYAEQMLAQLARSRLKSMPGSVAVYCNDCFTMAGLLVERVSGIPFTEYVQARVFEPLGMTASMYPTDPLEPGGFAPVIVDGEAQPPEYLNLYASGALFSTPHELARLAAVLLGDGTWRGRQVISPASIQQMGLDHMSGTLDPIASTAFRYGLGWDTVADPGLEAVGARGWGKGGDTVDYHAAFLLAPDSDVAVIITAAGRQVGSGMLSTLAQTVLRSAISEIHGAVLPPGASVEHDPPEARPTTGQLAAMVGSYAGSMLVRVAATPEDSLAVDAYAGGKWVPPDFYTLRSDGLFWSTTEPSRSLQTRSAWGRTYLVLQLAEPQGTFLETTILGEKVSPHDALRATWKERAERSWVIVNERSDSLLWNGNPTLTMADPDGTGYLWVTHAQGSTPVDPRDSDDLASMFVQLPGVNGRDMNDLRMLLREGEEWVQFGSATYRPVESIPPLEEGVVRISIGVDSAAQWRSVPAETRLSSTGDGSWRAYTADGDPIDVATGWGVLPAGSLVAVFGMAGETISLSAERI